MKTLLVRFVCVAILASSFTGAMAQRQNQNQDQNQNGRAGNVVRMMLEAQAAQSDPLQLIYRKDVQRDLGLDLGQRNKIDNFHDRQIKELQATRQQNRRNQAAVTEFQQKQKKEAQDKIDELITAGQKARLKQIALQLQGESGLYEPELQKQLGITEEQKLRLHEIRARRDAAMVELQDSMGRREILPQDMPTRMQQLQKEMNTSISEALTPEQQEGLKKLFGKPFKAA